MTATVEFGVELTTVNCGVCGGTHAINSRYRQHQKEKGGTWSCPYCRCEWGFAGSENQRLKKQLQRRERRKAKASGYKRDPRKMGRVGHGTALPLSIEQNRQTPVSTEAPRIPPQPYSTGPLILADEYAKLKERTDAHE